MILNIYIFFLLGLFLRPSGVTLLIVFKVSHKIFVNNIVYHSNIDYQVRGRRKQVATECLDTPTLPSIALKCEILINIIRVVKLHNKSQFKHTSQSDDRMIDQCNFQYI